MAEIERPVSASALIEGLEIQDRIQGDIFYCELLILDFCKHRLGIWEMYPVNY